MNSNRNILLIALACVLIAAGIYAYAYTKEQANPSSAVAPSQARGKIATSSAPDGTYTVQIHSFMTAGEDTSITFHPVAYFEGAEASSTATKEVTCEDKPLAACAPTLTKGYYVSATSSAPDFTAPITAQTQIALRDEPHATEDMLRSLQRQFDPVFDVDIEHGNVVLLAEKSPL